MSNILILTASPTRDLIVDTLLAEELRKRGHQASIRPCLREHRSALEDEVNKILSGECGFIPDTIVMPPIRNPKSRDMTEVFKYYGLGVISRHTEASCDKRDFEKMEGKNKADILGSYYPYYVDAELVWSKDEAEILAQQRPGVKFPSIACGSFTVDAYLREDIIEKHRNREKFAKDRKLDPERKNLLICSPWGFADTAPDLYINPIDDANNDTGARNRHFEMIKYLRENLKGWNIIVTIHPGVVLAPYQQFCKDNEICLDTETNSFDLKVNVDGIIHAGSTMAIGAHFLNIPSWQFGDTNAKDSDSWWGDPESDLSKISPYFKEPKELCKAISKSNPESNANPETLKSLENGRYGLMDGKATVRAAEIISGIKGKFVFRWPKSIRDYSQLRILQNEVPLITRMTCGICKEPFLIVNESYMRKVFTRYSQHFFPEIDRLKKEGKTAGEILDNMPGIFAKAVEQSMVFEHGPCCPHGAERFVLRDRPVE